MTELKMWESKKVYLFLILGGFFIANALLAEFIGVKIFSLEKSFGFEPLNLNILGTEGLGFNLTSGVLLWPVVFIMTDLINEYYGQSGVKIFSWFAAGIIVFAFAIIYLAVGLVPADFWIGSQLTKGVDNMQSAFGAVFGQGLWIIAGSLIAFLVGQFVDVYVFHKVKNYTGEKYIWARATGSTLVSQFIDSFVVLFIAFYIGAGWNFTLVISICVLNYTYKFLVAILLTPVLYGVHYLIESYLGDSLATKMRKEAQSDNAISNY